MVRSVGSAPSADSQLPDFQRSISCSLDIQLGGEGEIGGAVGQLGGVAEGAGRGLYLVPVDCWSI